MSDPVVTIDYNLLDSLPSEAREAILGAVAVMERLSDDPSPRKDVVAYRRPLTAFEADKTLKIAQDDWVRCSEINGWSIKEDRPPIASEQDRL